MSNIDFTHLHCHTSEGSLLDGAARLKKLVKRAKELNMTSLAITDHGTMYGVIDFYKECKKAGIKPILGSEVYVAPRRQSDRVPHKDDANYHLVLLAETNEGYQNLIALVSAAQLDGIYYKPRVDKDLLRKHSKGLIALSACIGGEVPQYLLEDKFDLACGAAKEYEDIFGSGNFYLELQDHGLESQRKVLIKLREVHKQTGIPLVATNDIHYVNKADAYIQDILLCISMGKTLNDSSRMKFESRELYLKSADEMDLIFGEHPEVLENTARIAERCNVEFNFGETFLPVFEIPEGYTTDSYLKELCEEAFPRFYPNMTEEERARLVYELEVITKTGFAGYFLIVSDFCRWSKNNGIVVGPGRGSAAASMVAYLLEITSVEPMRYNLLFERFLNPERISMPDIDIDFDPEGRLRVIHYVTQKYGSDKVCQIITFGTLGAKSAIKDVGRVLGIPLPRITKLTKAIPSEVGITLEKALETSPQLKELAEEDEEMKNLMKIAIALEGTPRHASTHAAGVVIAREALTTYIPLQRTSDDEGVMTQLPMKTVEELGLLKMDFLGLRNLTILQGAVDLIEQNHGIKIDLRYIPFDDPKTYALLATGNTTGIFQLESSGMRSVILNLKPNVFEDIIALVALYRPGPMDQIPEFIRRKHGGEITYLHPKLEPILEPTYGIIVYQEQVMQIARDLAGYSLGRADILRRAMGKKKKEIMDEERFNFIEGLQDDKGEWVIPGAVNLGVNRDDAAAIFDLMAKFAEYGFNKGHATAYAVISYQTAYLKANYPMEFTAALLSTVMSSPDKIAFYLNEARASGISVLPPDVQYSDIGFKIEGGSLRFGMAAIRNVGEGVLEKIIKERESGGPFKSLYDFSIRVEGLTMRVMESLIKAGAFASLCKRSQGMQTIDLIMKAAASRQKDKSSGQISLFDLGGEQAICEDTEIEMPDVAEFPEKELLNFEKEYLGLYLTGHPLAAAMHKLKNFVSTDIFTLKENDDDIEKVCLGGIIVDFKQRLTKKGEMMAIFTLEDLTGQIKVLVFPRTLAKIGPLMNDQIIFLEGKFNVQDEEKKIFAEKIVPIEKLGHSKNTSKKSTVPLKFKLYMRVNTSELEKRRSQVNSILKEHPGVHPYCFILSENRERVVGDEAYWTNGHPILIKRLEALLGKENVVWKG